MHNPKIKVLSSMELQLYKSAENQKPNAKPFGLGKVAAQSTSWAACVRPLKPGRGGCIFYHLFYLQGLHVTSSVLAPSSDARSP